MPCNCKLMCNWEIMGRMMEDSYGPGVKVPLTPLRTAAYKLDPECLIPASGIERGCSHYRIPMDGGMCLHVQEHVGTGQWDCHVDRWSPWFNPFAHFWNDVLPWFKRKITG